ncbi:MAG: PIG-L family deacetylase [Propionibacteriaceae bacterium]|jgi:N-acetyl-1-D-myo-inositol-2-amino-2-deoxy-alpha-D-glucopyranoside deacetylase|nr:PIG-L family deacetylase [Propionibacteriaceae bacterium]
MRYLFLHAHPDDETLSTGAIIVALRAAGHVPLVLTATRGERGEVVPGSLSAGPAPLDLAGIRAAERVTALAALGATDAGWLGAGSNRTPGQAPRRYRDSGMVWVTPTLAGPAPDAPADCLTRADPDEIVADVAAAATFWQADALVSYNQAGGYGHPDHVRCHEAARAAGVRLGLPAYEITDDHAGEWYEAGDGAPAVLAAHRAYRTQFTVDGDRVIHVGGQVEQIRYAGGWVHGV